MDWNNESWIDLLAKAHKILLGGVTGCVKIFFDGTASFPELVHEIIQFLIKCRIPVTVVNVTVELGICKARLFRLALLQNLVQVRLELYAWPYEHHKTILHHHISHLFDRWII